MTRNDIVNKIIEYAGDDYDEGDTRQLSLIRSYVDDAVEEVRNTMCPFCIPDDKLDFYTEMALKRYGNVIKRIAQFHFDKQGKEGVVAFTEAGQKTTYEKGGTPIQYLEQIVPMCGIV